MGQTRQSTVPTSIKPYGTLFKQNFCKSYFTAYLQTEGKSIGENNVYMYQNAVDRSYF